MKQFGANLRFARAAHRVRVVGMVRVAAMLLGTALVGAACGTPAGAVTESAADVADKAFLAAVQKGDATELGKLLDANFAWISANGKTLDRAGALKSLPKPAIADEGGADFTRLSYSDAVEAIEVNSGKMHELRIWVKRPEGWRALVYQEVRSLDAPLSFTPGAGSDCQNPCKGIPFTPQSAAQRDVASAYTRLESAAEAKNADIWSTLTAYEFIGATSNSVQLLDKATRKAQLEKKNMVGMSPTPVVSAQMYDFPDVEVMRSKQQPDRGNLLEITRLWVHRSTVWMIVLSYQTSVQPDAAGH